MIKTSINELLRSYSRKPDTLKIWDLSKAGLSPKQISHKTGFKFAKVNSALRRGREAKILPPIVKSQLSNQFGRQTYMRLGSVSSICNALSEDQLNWLGNEARRLECETVSEFILELVRDAHADQELNNG